MMLLMIIGVIALISYVINVLVDYSFCPKEMPKIKFKAFKKFYSINHERWDISDDYYVECKIYNNKKYKPYDGLFYSYTTEKFTFGLFDHQRYKKFKNDTKRNKLKEKKMQTTSRMLQAVKEDITNMENLAQQQQEQAVNNIKSILDNLGGTK